MPAEATAQGVLDETKHHGPGSAQLDVSTADGFRSDVAISMPEGDSLPELRHERFEIGGKLGEGGMGVVYRARDTRDGRDVALKLMKTSLAGSARQRFEREFRSLRALHHPHCLGVYDYGELSGSPFFTMELFLGRPITSLAGRSLPEVLDALLQLTHALDYIHGHGIIHRDIKPSNILVRPETRADGSTHFETRLMDFGLAKYYGVKTSLSAEAGFVGTVAYCAPEQINLDELDHRADLYCLGLVSYEVLSGCYVFPEARLAGMRPLIQAHLNDKPRPLSVVNPEVPAPIADVVMKYLRKQPRRRPDSAAVLRAAIAGYLGIDERSMVSGASLAEMRPGLSVTGFVCRTKEQEAIADVIRQSLRPARGHDQEVPPSLLMVSGEPGIGKSSVVQEAERIARGHGCQVYQGRCFDGNLSPFQPFVEILRQLIAEIRLQERREAAEPTGLDVTGTHVAGLPAQSLMKLQAIVNDYRGELLRIAPELRKYLPGEACEQVEFGRKAEYIHRALSAFFLEIATLQPICLSFEDLQWADKSSLDLLRHLAAAVADVRRSQSDGSTAAPRLIIVASARVGHDGLEALIVQLRDRRQVLDIRLAPLVEGETRELIALRLNCGPEHLSDDLVARVHALCGGNPFFVAETVRDWYEKDAISRSENGWVLASAATDTSDLPETVRDVMRLRLQGLSEQVQQVVRAAAVIGAVVDIDLLRDVLSDQSESDVLDAIDLLIPRRVFRETSSPGRVEFVHDLLRELPYADLTASRRRSLHRRVGELLEQRRASGQTVAAAVLADHFRNAEQGPKASGYAIEAAEAAIDAYAFNNAIAHLNDALGLLPGDVDKATLYRLWDMKGIAFGSSGRLDDAIGAYEKALEYALELVERATGFYGMGEAYHRKGEFDRSIRKFDLALREAGYPRPQNLAGILFDMWRASIVFHMLPSGVRLPGGGADRERRLRIACATYPRLCQITALRSVLRYSHCSYRFMAFARQSNDPALHAEAYSKFSLNCGMFSLAWLVRRSVRLAEKAAESCQNAHILATARAHVGCAHYFAGRLGDAETNLREAVAVLNKVGDWHGGFSHHVLRHLHGIRADFAAELAEAEFEIANGVSRGDSETIAWGHYGKAHALAMTGRVLEAERLATDAVAALPTRSTTIGVAYGILGFVRLQASDYAGARDALEQSRAAVFRAFCLYEFVGPTYPLLVESLLGPHWAMAETQRGPSRAIARRAWREGRFARFVGWRYPNYWPHALRVSGRAAFAMGEPKKAARYLEKSIAAADALGARYDLARALLDASLVIPERSDLYRRRGQKLLDELGAVVPHAERLPCD
jgi:tetratricopeptide (TPR) repeat protein